MPTFDTKISIPMKIPLADHSPHPRNLVTSCSSLYRGRPAYYVRCVLRWATTQYSNTSCYNTCRAAYFSKIFVIWGYCRANKPLNKFENSDRHVRYFLSMILVSGCIAEEIISLNKFKNNDRHLNIFCQ
jgi:hypothetical protein